MSQHPFTITESVTDNEARLMFSGELDLVVAAEVREAIAKHAQSERRKIIDLREVSFIDSRGLAAIFRSVKEAGVANVTVLPSDHLQPQRYFEIAGMTDLSVALEEVD